jgi:hypothetical protein
VNGRIFLNVVPVWLLRNSQTISTQFSMKTRSHHLAVCFVTFPHVLPFYLDSLIALSPSSRQATQLSVWLLRKSQTVTTQFTMEIRSHHLAVCFVDFFHFPPFYLDSLIASLPDGDAAIGALGSAAMPTAQSLHDFVGKECSVHPSMALAFSTASLTHDFSINRSPLRPPPTFTLSPARSPY